MKPFLFNRSDSQLHRAGSFRQLTALLTAGSLISGCTTSMTSVRDDTGPEVAAKGFRYHLPAREFKIEVNWRLEGCEGVTSAEWTAYLGRLSALEARAQAQVMTVELRDQTPLEPGPKLTFAADAKFEHEIVRGEAITIDHTKMAGAFKTSELKLSFFKKKVGGTEEDPIYASTGILQSFNGTIEGKEPEALEAAIGLAANIAKGVIMAGGPAGGAVKIMTLPPNLSANPCRPETLQMMTDLADAEKSIKEYGKSIEGVDKRIILLRKRIVDGVVTDADRKALEELNAELDKFTAKLKALTEVRDQLISYLSFPATCGYAPTELGVTTSCKVAGKDASVWLRKLLTAEAAENASTFADRLETRLWVERTGFGASAVDASPATALCTIMPPRRADLAGQARTRISAGAIDGFLYKEASMSRLCMQRLDLDNAMAAKDKVMINEVMTIPQFGKAIIVRLKSGFGEKSSLSFTFGADGNPLEAGHVKATAGGTELLKALKGGSASVLEVVELDAKLRKERADARKAAEKTEVQKIDEEIALLEAQQKLQRTRTQETSESAQLDAEIALLQRRRDLAKLKQEMIELSKP
jgi:hypothetical protein